MKQTKITYNLDGFEDIKKKIAGTYEARVGILGSGAAREDGEGISNAELGLIQIFGSISRNIPPRDFLLMPIVKNNKELVRLLGSGEMRQAFETGDYKRMYAILGIYAESFVQEAFETGGFGLWPPLKPATIRAKGSSTILINHAELRAAVSSDVVKKSGPTQHGVQFTGSL